MKALISVSLEKIGHYDGYKKDYSKNYNYITTTQTGTRYQNMSKSQSNNNKKSNEEQ
jgi:hypothetical protein